MPDKSARYERMLFDYQTTNRTDIRDGEIKTPINTTYKWKPSCLAKRPPPLKFTHTMVDWKNEVVPPFDLLLKPKEIVRTNPWICQNHYEKPIDTERERVQRTRPRLVMTPAVSMDDVEDNATRDILCRAVYTTTVMQANAEGVKPYLRVEAPLGRYPARADIIKLRRAQVPYVHPAWKSEMLQWDNKQLRSYVDVDKEFWMRQKTTCTSCDKTSERK